VQRQDRLGVEQLEQRLPPGAWWDPATGIDVLGICAPGAGPFVVAGSIIEFEINGSGEDWDHDMQPGGGVMYQDELTFTWSGASCQVINEGKSALCQIGTAGTGSFVDIFLDADDVASMAQGDEGSRDDLAVHVGTQKIGIWVTIQAKYNGLFDTPNNQLTVADEADNTFLGKRTAGPTTPGDASDGFFSKVELTGTVAPADVANGKEGFEWKQIESLVKCYQQRDGTWTGGVVYPPPPPDGPGGFSIWHADGPLDDAQQKVPKNNKIYMVDNPGAYTGPNADFEVDMYDRKYFYADYMTHVEFNNVRASIDYQWHVVVKLSAGTDANGNRVWGLEVPRDVGIGLQENPASGDCSVRP
jgi:hypothetical protein